MEPNQDPSAIQSSVGTANIPYHRHGGSDGPLIPLSNVNGYLPMVTGTPTFTPTGSINTGMALDSTTGVIYYYDFTNKVWKSTQNLTLNSANFFGDGSDGNATLDGTNTYSFLTKSGSTYTCNRDVYFNNLTINTGVTLQSGGYFIFIYGILTRSGTGIITNNGGDGGDGGAGGNAQSGSGTTGGSAGTAGAAAAGISVPAGLAGKVGVVGGAGSLTLGSTGYAGTGGTATTNSLSASGVAGGAGGNGEGSGYAGGSGEPAGTAGTATASASSIRDVIQARELACRVSGTLTAFTGGASSSSGGSGGAGSGGQGIDNYYGGAGGGSGGSGAPGGFLIAFVNKIVAANTNALFQAKGGKGGNGGKGGDGHNVAGGAAAGGGGGGSGGGTGGVVALIYASCDQTVASILDVSGGVKGTGGQAGAQYQGGTGTAGTDGTAGNTGTAISILASV